MNDQNRARKRLIQTFGFLKGLNQLRYPTPHTLDDYRRVLRIDSWPRHKCISTRYRDFIENFDTEHYHHREGSIIQIRRVDLTPCPKPPAAIRDWLNPGWSAVHNEISVVQTKNVVDPITGETTRETLTASRGRVSALRTWECIREEWKQDEVIALAARRVFENIYTLYTTLQREGDDIELVLADGMLHLPDYQIHHPVLIQPLSLTFDPSGPEFYFTAENEKIELHRSMLRQIPILESKMITIFEKELEAEPLEILDQTSTNSFLRRMMHGFFKDGEFIWNKELSKTCNGPCLWREPVILLRPRAAGLNTTLDYIIEDLESNTSRIPPGMGRIMGVSFDGADTANESETAHTDKRNEYADILFTKPANTEQLEIAHRLAKDSSIVVQGPPGTGKTHTIANLLGHLLSEGRTVLVTAHTTKALRVLRDKVDEALQPLCISVLHRDSESQSQLEHAARDIIHRLSYSDPSNLRSQSASLRVRRTQLLKEAASIKDQLRQARSREIDEVVFNGKALRPIEVAKRLHDTADADGWIPALITRNVTCPLSGSQIRKLYALHEILTIQDEKELSVEQPTATELMNPANFALLAKERIRTESVAKYDRSDLWDENKAQRCTLESVGELCRQISSAKEVLHREKQWLREVLYAGWSGDALEDVWRGLLSELEALKHHADITESLRIEFGPQLPADRSIKEVISITAKIVKFLNSRKSSRHVGFRANPRWNKLTQSCTVAGGKPQSMQEFNAILHVAQLAHKRQLFVGRWCRAVDSCQGPRIPDSADCPERVAEHHTRDILTSLNWNQQMYEPLIMRFDKLGFHWETWLNSCDQPLGEHGKLDHIRQALSDELLRIVNARVSRIIQTENAKKLHGQRTYLLGFPQSTVAIALVCAQDSWAVDSYASIYADIARLNGLRTSFIERKKLLAKLKSRAPSWADAIRRRQDPHDSTSPPGKPKRAWRWRQWHQELERRAKCSINELQKKYQSVLDRIQEISAEIIEREAWASQRERTGLSQQQALTGFVQTIGRIGKGHGKRAPEFRRRAQQLLASARSAVPVWIMPLSRVYESFSPLRDKFDVVIIDEASQSDVTALAALYLGHRHVVVGDKEQVTPDAVGQRVDDVARLIETDLQGVPNRHLYDGQMSIYDVAEASFGGVIALREHFRSVPDIIEFSNQLSYDNKIDALREASSACISPAVISQRVEGHRVFHDKTNTVEAEEVVSLMLACLSLPAYQRNENAQWTSFGVISLLGEEQALVIEDMLRRQVAPEVFERHRILCGSAAQFQGDERDVVFLSMVDSPSDDGVLSMRGFGANNMFKKRYNVAVSRARNQLWLVHSLDPSSHLKSGDLRRRLIEHVRDPSRISREIRRHSARTESEFEKLVLQRLISAGYRVRPQWRVGGYRIDLVVFDNNGRLAVECDGHRWHHSKEQLESDFQRQALLERLGWVFVRIPGSLFFRDPDRAMKPVFDRLTLLGILTGDGEGDEFSMGAEDGFSHVEHVRQIAARTRTKWKMVDGDVSDDQDPAVGG